MLCSKWGAYPFKYASWVINKEIHWTSTNLIFSEETSLKRHFPPLPPQASQVYTLSSQQPPLYSDLQFTFTYITSIKPWEVLFRASSTPTKQRQIEGLGFKEVSPGRLAGMGPITGMGYRNKGWEGDSHQLMWLFLFQRERSTVVCSPGRPDAPFPSQSFSQPVPGCSILAHILHSQLQLSWEWQSALGNSSPLPSGGSSLIVSS